MVQYPLLSVKQVAERLSVSRWTVYDLLDKGQLTKVKVNGAIRIPLEALDAFIASNSDPFPITNGPTGRCDGSEVVADNVSWVGDHAMTVCTGCGERIDVLTVTEPNGYRFIVQEHQRP